MSKRRARGVRRSRSFVGLLSLGLLALAQNNSIAYWSLPNDRMDALVLQVPANDRARYQELRDEFTGLHCPPVALREQPTGKRDASNLICTLPGNDAGSIVVAARYDHTKGNAASERWSDAIMLPLLYNALKAQPRMHTFIIAALNGEAGERAFFNDLGKDGRHIDALVVLDALGRSVPFIYTASQEGSSKKGSELATAIGQLASEAIATAALQKLPNPRLPFPMANNSILTREYQTPSILIFSSAKIEAASQPGQHDRVALFPFPETVSGPAFRQGFNFVAYFLCRIDIKVPV